MASVILYYQCGSSFGSSEYDFPDGESLPDNAYPSGCTPMSQAQYEAALAQLAADREAADERLRLEEARQSKRIAGAGTVLVAAANAPNHVKTAALYVCSGADDQVEINAAIAEVVAGGGKVSLSAGTFLLSEPVIVPASQTLTVEGTGWATRLLMAPGRSRYLVTFTGGGDTRVQFRDMTLDGNHLNQTGGGCIWAPGAVQCLFENLHVTGFYNIGIYLGGQNGGAFGHHNRVINCLFDNTMDGAGLGTAIHMDSSDENFVIGCDFEYLGGVRGRAAAILDQGGTQVISTCNFVNGRPGLPVIRVQDTRNTKVIGCNFDGVGGDGVFLSASQCAVTANTFFNVGLHAAPGLVTGIHTEYAARNNVISGNTLTTADTDGAANSLIREDGDGDAGPNFFHGNVLIENGTTAFGVMTLGGRGSVARDNVGAPGGDGATPLRVVDGPVSDASFPANRPPVDGTLAVDGTNRRLYVRLAGVWVGADLT